MIEFKWLKSDRDWLPKLINLSAAFFAIILIVMGYKHTWFALPTLAGEELDTVTSESTVYFKACHIALYCLCFSLFLLSKKRRVSFFMAVNVLAVLVCLYFPTFIGQRDVKLIGDAAWLQQQHDNMTWLGGDVYRAHSERSLGWGQGVNAQDPPARLAVYRAPDGALGIEQLDDWVWWLGYGPSFTQFVSKGWFFSVSGSLLLFLCAISYSWRKDMGMTRLLIRRQFIVLCVLVMAYSTVSSFPVFQANRKLKEARYALSTGDYQKAYRYVNSACFALPTLKCDTGIIYQLGYLELTLAKKSSGYSELYHVYEYENGGYYHRARKIIEDMTSHFDKYPVEIQRELMRQQLRVSINEINSNRELLALQRLDKILAVYPASVQALLHSQLIYLKNGNLEALRSVNRKLLSVYKKYQSKNKRGVISLSYLMLAQAELERGNAGLAAEARRLSKGL